MYREKRSQDFPWKYFRMFVQRVFELKSKKSWQDGWFLDLQCVSHQQQITKSGEKGWNAHDFSKVHSIQHHVYPFFPKETRRWCLDDVVVVWLRWPRRFGQIAASKVGERKRSRIAASKKTASDVLFQKLFRSSSPIFISCSSALGGNSHGFISIESDMTLTSYYMNSFATWTFLRWGPFFFTRPHLPVECESMWIGQPVSFVVNHAAPKAPWES